eukprot:11162110-Lingulodinium_polyedra.AAC.1
MAPRRLLAAGVPPSSVPAASREASSQPAGLLPCSAWRAPSHSPSRCWRRTRAWVSTIACGKQRVTQIANNEHPRAWPHG